MQPGADGVVPPVRRRLASQQQKGGLKDVLGVLFAGQQSPTDVEYQGAVTLDEGGEGVLLPRAGKAQEQVAVSRIAARGSAGQPLDVSQQSAQLGSWHDERLG